MGEPGASEAALTGHARDTPSLIGVGGKVMQEGLHRAAGGDVGVRGASFVGGQEIEQFSQQTINEDFKVRLTGGWGGLVDQGGNLFKAVADGRSGLPNRMLTLAKKSRQALSLFLGQQQPVGPMPPLVGGCQPISINLIID